MKFKILLKNILFVLLSIVVSSLILLVFRLILPRQLDDVNPNIPCLQNLLDKSETLMVIPLFENKSIAENITWCNYILSLNKTLGMHGVYHSYNEFSEARSKEYVRIGMEEFKKCFSFYPTIFEAPQVALLRDNEKVLREMNFEVRGYPYQIMHKVYHCSDTGKYSNRFVDWI
mgnify:CR=1 FL=1